MKRLTNKTSIMGRKHDLAYGCASIWKKKLSKHYRYNLIEEAVDKLGQLEDIEEELGIDLITLFKALRDGVYCKGIPFILRGLSIHTKDEIGMGFCDDREFFNEIPVLHLWSDYGKTWWLEKPKEELENE